MRLSRSPLRAGDSPRASRHDATKLSASGAIATMSPNMAFTSWMGVETIGLPAAMYSSVLVGLMNSVDSLSANGIRHTSHPATSCGSTEYDCWPSQ
jgi:hypothetical protein